MLISAHSTPCVNSLWYSSADYMLCDLEQDTSILYAWTNRRGWVLLWYTRLVLLLLLQMVRMEWVSIWIIALLFFKALQSFALPYFSSLISHHTSLHDLSLPSTTTTLYHLKVSCSPKKIYPFCEGDTVEPEPGSWPLALSLTSVPSAAFTLLV